MVYRVMRRYAWMATVLIALAVLITEKELPVKVPHTDKHIRYIGRFDFTDATGPRAAWPGVSVIFRFQGTAVNAVMKDFPSDRKNSKREDVNYFNIIIDDGKPTVLALDPSKTSYPIARNLKRGAHTVEIFRRTEPQWGEHQFLGVELLAGSQMLPTPPRLKRRVEFIGDSITCGYGNESKGPKEPFLPATENNYLTYGAITARMLEAEYVCIAWSGKGVYQNRGKNPKDTLPDLYGRTLPYRAESVWNFKKMDT